MQGLAQVQKRVAQYASRTVDGVPMYPGEAINFVIERVYSETAVLDFLETWRDGGWSEIEAAYPEFLAQVDGK